MPGPSRLVRISHILEANVAATHAYQAGLARNGKGNAPCWSAGGLSDDDLKALVRHQQSLLGENPQSIKAWVEGKDSAFDSARDLEPILASPLRPAVSGFPVNVYTHYFSLVSNVRSDACPHSYMDDALACRAAASLLQMMLDIDRDGDLLQQMFALYVALGLSVHTEGLGLPERTDEEFLRIAEQLAPRMCPSPVDTSPPALRMLFRKMWIWGHRHTGERDRRVVAMELLAEPEIQSILPKVRAMPAQKIAVIGHSFTMEVNWASPSAFVPFVAEILKEASPYVEIRQWAGGGLNPARADCRRFTEEALAWKPARVLFVVACWSDKDAAALAEMVERFGRAGIEVMAFDPLRPDDRMCGIDPETLKSISARHRMMLIEVGPLFAASPDRGRLVCLDGIHMTEPYHRLMAKEWLKYLAGARRASLQG